MLNITYVVYFVNVENWSGYGKLKDVWKKPTIFHSQPVCLQIIYKPTTCRIFNMRYLEAYI